jgi:hypothetical protein
MKIQAITFEMGNDFHAELICEHCGYTQRLTTGYHDNYFHTKVIPTISCRRCGLNRSGEPEPRSDTEHREKV